MEFQLIEYYCFYNIYALFHRVFQVFRSILGFANLYAVHPKIQRKYCIVASKNQKVTLIYLYNLENVLVSDTKYYVL